MFRYLWLLAHLCLAFFLRCKKRKSRQRLNTLIPTHKMRHFPLPKKQKKKDVSPYCKTMLTQQLSGVKVAHFAIQLNLLL